MWAHYGMNHLGFAIGFDAENAFFHDSEEYGNTGAFDVEYVDQRPTLDADIRDFRVLTTKSSEWSYEDEVRVFRSFSDVQPSIGKDQAGYPIHLIDFPPDALREVVLGARASRDLAQRIERALNSKAMNWVKIRQAALSDTDFALQISETARHKSNA